MNLFNLSNLTYFIPKSYLLFQCLFLRIFHHVALRIAMYSIFVWPQGQNHWEFAQAAPDFPPRAQLFLRLSARITKTLSAWNLKVWHLKKCLLFQVSNRKKLAAKTKLIACDLPGERVSICLYNMVYQYMTLLHSHIA